MGKSTDDRKGHPVLVHLRRWKELRKVTYRHLEERWGLTDDPVYRRLAGQHSLNLKEIDGALELIGLDRNEFLAGVAEGFFPELLLDDVAGRDRDQVRNFRKSLRKRRPRRVYDAAEVGAAAAGLEALRFRDAHEARELALDVLRTADLDPDAAAETWGVLGVLERYAGRVAVAAFCLSEALRLAASERTRARTLQRIAMLLLYTTGDADAAMKACRRAAVCYLSCRDLAGMGKTLVDEGVVLLNGQAAYGEALRAYEKALELLPDTEPVYRFGATQGSAVAAVYLGDVAGALEHLDGALAELAAQESSLMYASLLWLKGEIALLLEQYLEAADHFLGVWDCCVDLDLSPLETTLVSLRMAKAYFLQGDRRQVRRILHEMVSSLAEVERSHPLLGAALGEFLREGVRGEVTAEALEEIYRKLREGTETAPPLLPLTLPAS